MPYISIKSDINSYNFNPIKETKKTKSVTLLLFIYNVEKISTLLVLVPGTCQQASKRRQQNRTNKRSPKLERSFLPIKKMISSNGPTTPAPTANAEEKKNDETSPRTAVILRPNLPPYIKALALRNRKKRFFVPSSMNFFGGISYPNVMIDNECSSLLLPYPGMEALQAFSSNDFIWKIGSSGGTGRVNSVVLLIKHYKNPSVGFVNLAGSNVMPLPYLRIHLDTRSAQEVIDSKLVDNYYLTKLQDYVAMKYPPKTRHHVLLGQMVLDKMVSVQHNSAFVLCSELPSEEDMASVHKVLNVLGKPEHFDEWEDDDHDGDADFEENFDPWEEEVLMDEQAD